MMQTSLIQRSHGPLPLIVGVTGHRDVRPQDIAGLERSVRTILTELQSTYSNTPIVLLSSLADGADRLVAGVALSLKMELVVPLPMPKEEYEKDFNEKSRREFNGILEQARQAIVMPWVGQNTAENITGLSSETRAGQYAAAGAFIVGHSQVMIALWDGRVVNKTGGTSQIVEFARKGIPHPYAGGFDGILNAPNTGVIYHLWTPRETNPDIAKPPFTVDLLFPQEVNPEKGKTYYETIFSQMNRFNKNAGKIIRRSPEKLEKSRKELISGNPPLAVSDIAEQVQVYACADVLSQKFRKRYCWAIRCILAMVVLSIAVFGRYDYPGWKHLAAYLLILLVAWFIFKAVKWQFQWEDKYLDYRAIAEALRVQIFWKLVGIKRNIIPYYLPQHRSELDWIRNTLRSSGLRMIQTDASEVSSRSAPFSSAVSFVLSNWVMKQARYFRKTSRLKEWWETTLYGISRGIFKGTLILMALITVIGFLDHSLEVKIIHDNTQAIRRYHGIGLHVSTLALAFAGALEGYRRMLAIHEEARRYKIMSDLFRQGKIQLHHLTSRQAVGKAQGILFTLGKEALQENGDWLLMHRGRMEFPR